MKTARDFCMDSWRRMCRLPPATEPVVKLLPNSADLAKSEWSPTFEQLMRNRLVFGAYRYGLLGDPSKPQFDRVQSVKNRLDLYETTGNLEHLVDVANLCLLEFCEGRHPNRHLAAIDDGEHTAPIPCPSRSETTSKP